MVVDMKIAKKLLSVVISMSILAVMLSVSAFAHLKSVQGRLSPIWSRSCHKSVVLPGFFISSTSTTAIAQVTAATINELV